MKIRNSNVEIRNKSKYQNNKYSKHFKFKYLDLDIISNFVLRASNFQSSAGFTLIELVIVIALVGIIGTITTQVFLINIRSQNKSEILKEVKQNGDYALSIMESMIRNANDISNAQCNALSLANTLTILNQDGNATTFDCSDDTKIASISSTAQYAPESLTSSHVKITNCFFEIICPTPALSPKYVYMGFRICQEGADSCPDDINSSVDTRATLDYETTVTLRNY